MIRSIKRSENGGATFVEFLEGADDVERSQPSLGQQSSDVPITVLDVELPVEIVLSEWHRPRTRVETSPFRGFVERIDEPLMF